MREDLLHLPQSFETERTVLKKFKPGDGALFYEIVCNNQQRLIHSFPVILSIVTNEVNAELFIRSRLNEWAQQISFTFAIWDKSEKFMLGHMSIKNIDWVIPRAELAYMITEEYEGKGIMTEVLKSTIIYCFETLKMNKIVLRVITSNDKSFKVAEKCGFIREGTLRNEHRTFNGELVDLYYYGMTREDYYK